MFKFKSIMTFLMVLCMSHIGISQEKYAVLITGEKVYSSSNNIPLASQWNGSRTAVTGLQLPESIRQVIIF